MISNVDIILGFMSVGLAVLGLMTTWLLFVVKTWQTSIEQLRREDNELRQEIGAINILVAGQYVTTERFDKGMNAQREQFEKMLAAQTGVLVSAIDRIDKKLDGKADK